MTETATEINGAIGVQVEVPSWNDQVEWSMIHSFDLADDGLYGYYDEHQGEYLKISELRAADLAAQKAEDLLKYYTNVRVVKIEHKIERTTEVL